MNTAPSSPTRALSITMITSTSFYLSWSEPSPADQNGLIRWYLVNITELDTGSVFSYIATTTEFTAELLHPYYYYTCSVSAVTVSAGPYSSSQTIQTEIDGMCITYRSSLAILMLHILFLHSSIWATSEYIHSSIVIYFTSPNVESTTTRATERSHCSLLCQIAEGGRW